MYSQLSYHAAGAHHQDLLRAAKAARVTDELPRQSRFAHVSRIFALRLGRRRASVASASVEVSPSV